MLDPETHFTVLWANCRRMIHQTVNSQVFISVANPRDALRLATGTSWLKEGPDLLSRERAYDGWKRDLS
jgi:hypothetical protein